MNADQMKHIKEKYQEAYGDAGIKFLTFVIEQNLQIDLVKAAVESALDKNEEAVGQILDTFGTVHSHLTDSFAKAMNLSDELASEIFDTASETYEVLSSDFRTGDIKTND